MVGLLFLQANIKAQTQLKPTFGAQRAAGLVPAKVYPSRSVGSPKTA